MRIAFNKKTEKVLRRMGREATRSQSGKEKISQADQRLPQDLSDIAVQLAV